MVKSQLSPENIDYKELRTIDDEDVGIEVSLYELPFEGRNLIIALGKEKYTYSKYNVVYYPVYLIINDLPKAKIGIFEVDSNNLINLLDEDGDISLEKGNVLLYSFISRDFINDLYKKYPETILEDDKEIEKIEKSDDIQEYKLEQEEIDDDMDVMRLRLPKPNIQTEKINKSLQEGVFKIDSSKKIPVMLQEENEDMANTIKNKFMESSRNEWIEGYMKNNNYDIVENESNGDCFFAVIRNAFEQIGKVTTVDKLRALLAKEATDDVYQNYRTLYVNFLAEFQSKEKEMKDIKKISTELKKRSEKTSSKEENKKILEEAKQMIQKYNTLKLEKEDIKELLEEFRYMETIDTFDKFKEFIQTPNYWADTWAISTMEKLLNIKMIILSEEAYVSGDLDSVLKCGQLNDDVLEKQGKFVPDYYIMTGYSGNHYELISYGNKRILKFSEIPYDIKSLIINKCMEKNAGPYYLIQDFRNLKVRLGLSPDEGAPVTDDNDEELMDDLYDSNIVFMIHAKSDGKPKAGTGSGEKISKINMSEFNTLNKNDVCKDWRRKLDDTWTVPFELDGHRWGSVEHYYLGSQFKKGFPDFYLQFSLDSETGISKDIVVAKAAGGKTGKFKDKVLRPKNVKVDPDFEVISENPRYLMERQRALEAKFTQNMDMKKILMETKNAKLAHFVRSSPPVPDEALMKIRHSFTSAEV